ncbi:MAG: ABC transporter permease [Candidatus Lokiarchaeota archaeon]|nr:ABC transporter permease [Candidatus Lokiarchaeota archaeon]
MAASGPQIGMVDANQDLGRMRKSNQVLDTIHFEIQRSKVKFIMLCALAAGLFVIVAVVFGFLPTFGITRPADPLDFLVSGLSLGESMGGEELGLPGGLGITFFSGLGFSFVGTIIYLCAAVLGGPSIAGEWDKKTGHMLFPKVDRLKLLVGRLAGHYILCAVVVSLFYVLVAVYTGIAYGRVPVELLASYGIAQLFAFAILCLVYLVSALMPNSTGAIIFTIIFFVEGLLILTQVASMFSTWEPLWSPSYIANLIPYVMKMPDPRSASVTIPNPTSPTSPDLTVTTWFTPTLPGGILILAAFAAGSLCLAYFLFRRRQI